MFCASWPARTGSVVGRKDWRWKISYNWQWATKFGTKFWEWLTCEWHCTQHQSTKIVFIIQLFKNWVLVLTIFMVRADSYSVDSVVQKNVNAAGEIHWVSVVHFLLYHWLQQEWRVIYKARHRVLYIFYIESKSRTHNLELLLSKALLITQYPIKFWDMWMSFFQFRIISV